MGESGNVEKMLESLLRKIEFNDYLCGVLLRTRMKIKIVRKMHAVMFQTVMWLNQCCYALEMGALAIGR